jgi:transcription initiation factor TFIID subunit 8
MLHFLRDVKTFMEACHRNEPIPHDFAAALTRAGITPSSLLPHLAVPFPPEIVQPALRPRSPEPEPLPSLDDLDAVLGEELSGRAEKAKRRYIPACLPDLPPKHTWQATLKVKERETDPIKIREKLVEESRTASDNLRRLDAALREADRAKAAANPRPRTQLEEELQPIWEKVRAHVMKRDEEAFKKWKEERGIEGHHHFGWSLFGAGDAMYDPKNQLPLDLRDGRRITDPNHPGRR